MKGPREGLNSISWQYLAGYFDGVGSLSDHHRTRGKGWAYRLRIPSYDRELLEDLRRLLDVGSISQEKKPSGPYYRLELAGRAQVAETLERLLPFLRTKRVLVEEWLRNH